MNESIFGWNRAKLCKYGWWLQKAVTWIHNFIDIKYSSAISQAFSELLGPFKMWLKVPMPNTWPADVSRRLEIHWKKLIEAGHIFGDIKHRGDFSGLFPLSSWAMLPKSRKRASRGALLDFEVSFFRQYSRCCWCPAQNPFPFPVQGIHSGFPNART